MVGLLPFKPEHVPCSGAPPTYGATETMQAGDQTSNDCNWGTYRSQGYQDLTSSQDRTSKPRDLCLSVSVVIAQVASCAACSPDAADFPFDCMLDQVMLLSRAHTDYFMPDPVLRFFSPAKDDVPSLISGMEIREALMEHR
jgi:hypothetical protein